MTYANKQQLIILNSFVKEEIAAKLGWSMKTFQQRFARELNKLVRAGIIKKYKTSTYQVNPELIGKGDWKDIRKLRATFNLETGKVTHEYSNDMENREEEPQKEDAKQIKIKASEQLTLQKVACI